MDFTGYNSENYNPVTAPPIQKRILSSGAQTKTVFGFVENLNSIPTDGKLNIKKRSFLSSFLLSAVKKTLILLFWTNRKWCNTPIGPKHSLVLKPDKCTDAVLHKIKCSTEMGRGGLSAPEARGQEVEGAGKKTTQEVKRKHSKTQKKKKVFSKNTKCPGGRELA